MYHPIDLQIELNRARDEGKEREMYDLLLLLDYAKTPTHGPTPESIKVARNRQSQRRRLRKERAAKALMQRALAADLKGRTVICEDGVQRVVDMVHEGTALFIDEDKGTSMTLPIKAIKAVLSDEMARLPVITAPSPKADHGPCEALYHAIWDVIDNFAPGDPSIAGLEAAARAYEEHMKE